MSGDQIDGGKESSKISLIGREHQRYHDPEIDLDFSENETVNSEYLRYKSKLRIKNEMIAKLKTNLNTACSVARTVADAKEKQKETLENKLLSVKQENLDLTQKLKEQFTVVTNLYEQNIKLQNTIECLSNMVQLGFKELKKLRCELAETPSIVVQLKNIILCCGQYYADYCNEKETSKKLKSKNRFLTKKIYILENNLDSLSEQLKHQQYLNMRNRKLEHNNTENPKLYKTIAACSDLKIKQSGSSSFKTSFSDEETQGESVLTELEKKLDLTSHFTMVRKLMNDQDSLSNDLKIISQDVCNS